MRKKQEFSRGIKVRLTLAKVEGFGKLGFGNFVNAVEVGDGLGDFDDFKVGTSGKI